MPKTTKRRGNEGPTRVRKGDPGTEFMELLGDILRAAVGDGHRSPGQGLAALLAAARGVEHMLDVGFGPAGVQDIGSAHALVNSMPMDLLCQITSESVDGILGITHPPTATKKPTKKRRKVRR